MTIIEYVEAIEKLGISKKRLAFLLMLSVATTLFESLGLSMVVPIYDLISANGKLSDLPDTRYWSFLFVVASLIGIELGIGVLLLLAFVAVLFRQVVVYVRQMSIAFAKERVAKINRDKLFKGYLYSNLTAQEKLKSGELVNVITIELQRFNSSFVGFISLSNVSVLIVIYGIILIWTSWQMAIIAMFGIMVATIPIRALYRQTLDAGKSATKANKLSTEFLIERLAPVRLIRLSRTEPIEISKMQEFTKEQQRTMVGQERLMALATSMIEPINLGIGFMMIYFSISFLEVKLSSLAVFLLIILRLLPVAKDVIKSRQLITAYAASAFALQSMLDRLNQSAETKGGSLMFKGLKSQLIFRGVNFSYSDSKHYALKDINLTINSGSFVIIAGPSGAGKSTLIDLLPALRTYDSGSIEVDEIKIEEFDLKSLRESIAYVSQQPQIYDIPIADHVRLGRKNATDIEVEEALSLSGAGFVCELPDGIYTRLGHAGTGFSGGQCQRIDLARAIISGASVLILDEPTSALDSQSEMKLIKTLKLLSSKYKFTILVVTHRLAMVNYANQVIVMRNGSIEASGSLEEVCSSSAWFASAYSTYFGSQHSEKVG